VIKGGFMSESKLYGMLKDDHEKVKGLLKKTVNDETDKHFSTLVKELEEHMKGEESHFYPKLEDKNKKRILEGYEEHRLTKQVLRELDEERTGDEKWFAKVSVLKDLVEHHIEEEEDEIFSIAKDNLSTNLQNEIAEKIEKDKS
jgi:hypothetical protein